MTRGISNCPIEGVLLILLCLLGGCREGPSSFDAADRVERTGPPWQLTYSAGDDRSPVWNAAGDSIYYSADGFGSLARTNGVLLGIPYKGGVVDVLFPVVQAPSGASHWLVAPAFGPGGKRIAFAEVWGLWLNRLMCPGGAPATCSPEPSFEPLPELAEVRIRVRSAGDRDPINESPTLAVEFQGWTRGFLSNGVWHNVVHLYPFQREFVERGSAIFRPSWSPDGERIVYSNGLGLLMWQPGSGDDPQLIPGTPDGVWPAWNPRGDWIAFTRLERVDSLRTFCTHRGEFGKIYCTTERMDYRIGRHVLSLVRPDGSRVMELGTGDTPAWGPNGDVLYYRRANRIWRMKLATREAEPVSGTEGGREPAVSPDGEYIAFARLTEDGDHDIWIVGVELQE